jgi:hypothetical protein
MKRHLFTKPVSSELYKQQVFTAYVTEVTTAFTAAATEPHASTRTLTPSSQNTASSLYSVCSTFTGEWHIEADTEGNNLILSDAVTKPTKAGQRIRVSYIVNIQLKRSFII